MAVCRTLVIRTLTLGDGTAYRLGKVSGFGVPDVRANDVERGHADGVVGQNDYYDARPVLVEVTIGPPTSPDVEAVFDAWDLLAAAWAKSMIDIPLAYTVGNRTMTVYGRPRGAALDDTMVAQGDPLLRAQLAFRALDPTIY